jgi:predicted GIY-YIG superfamily endonuclease
MGAGMSKNDYPTTHCIQCRIDWGRKNNKAVGYTISLANHVLMSEDMLDSLSTHPGDRWYKMEAFCENHQIEDSDVPGAVKVPGSGPVFTLYRYWRFDELLYVGKTTDPPRRMKQHKTSQEWWPLVTHQTMEHFSTQAGLDKAEKIAINAEKPKHNKQIPDYCLDKQHAEILFWRVRNRWAREPFFEKEPPKNLVEVSDELAS